MNMFEDYMTPIDRKEEACAVASLLESLVPRCDGSMGGGCTGGTDGSEGNGSVGGCRAMPSLAMVYSPEQTWRDIYEPDEALRRGTLFSELYFPLEREKGWHGK